jgi:hypothetical protein
MPSLIGVLQAISCEICYVVNFKVRKNAMSRSKDVTGVYSWRPELQGCIPG